MSWLWCVFSSLTAFFFFHSFSSFSSSLIKCKQNCTPRQSDCYVCNASGAYHLPLNCMHCIYFIWATMPSVASCLDGNVVKQDFAVEKKVNILCWWIRLCVCVFSLFFALSQLIYLSPFASGNENWTLSSVDDKI